MVIHGDLYIGAVETWKGALDPEIIATLPNDILLRGQNQSVRTVGIMAYIFSFGSWGCGYPKNAVTKDRTKHEG